MNQCKGAQNHNKYILGLGTPSPYMVLHFSARVVEQIKQIEMGTHFKDNTQTKKQEAGLLDKSSSE